MIKVSDTRAKVPVCINVKEITENCSEIILVQIKFNNSYPNNVGSGNLPSPIQSTYSMKGPKNLGE